jgi:hypothetical protein
MHVVERMSYDWPLERSVSTERVRRLGTDMTHHDFGALIVTEPSDIYRTTGDKHPEGSSQPDRRVAA